MDPLSITAASASILAAIDRTVLTTQSYASIHGATRADLTAVLRELSDFQLSVEMLNEDRSMDSGSTGGLPLIKTHILGIIASSEEVISAIQDILTRHVNDGIAQPGWWLLSGKKRIGDLQQSLAIHRSAIELGLDIASW